MLEGAAPPRGGESLAGLFVTGTDTGAGKTVVTAAVARLFRERGRPVAVGKPVATGASFRDGSLVSDDTLSLAAAAGLGADAWTLITPWAFPDPVAPPVAARRSGVTLNLSEITRAVRRLARPGVPVLVEAVGGLLCPLTDLATVADLAAALGMPLLVAARRSLGTLNHTLLTLEVARHRGLRVAGVVVCETEPPRSLAAETNVAEMRRLGVPVLAVVPHRTDGTPGGDDLAAVDWWRLCQTPSEPERGRSAS